MTDNYWTRRLNRRRFVAGSATLAAGSAAMLAGCGDDDAKPAGTATAASTGSAAASSAATTAAANAPVKGGTFRNFKLAVDPGVDPAIYHLNNYEPVNLTYTQVMTYQVSKNKFAMDGMVKFEQIDATTAVFTVRDGMKFHNGDPVTAEDWAYSMTRIPIITKERRGHAGTPLFNYIDSVTATDATHATMKMNRPNPSMPIHMARQYFAFVNKKVVEAQPVSSGGPTKDIQEGPKGSGSGPYLLEKRDATGTTLVRNPNYYKHSPADDGFVEDGPYIDRIETKVIPDVAGQKAAFLAGDLDYLGAIDPLEVEDFKKNKSVRVAEAENGALLILAFDHKKLFDARARQAIRMAVNYDAFGASIFGGKFVYQSPVNRLLKAFQPFDDAKLKAQYKFDGTEAKKLWEAAGKPVDKIRILTGNDGDRGVAVADFAAQSLKQALGIEVVVDRVDGQTWAQRANRVPDKDWELLQSGTGIAGGTSGVPEDSHLIWFDPRAYMPLAFNAEATEGYGGKTRDDLNPGLKADTQTVLDLMKKQEVELDVAKRKQILTDLQTFIFDKAMTGVLLPIAAKQNLAISARMQDTGDADWVNYYAYRRASMWIKPS